MYEVDSGLTYATIAGPLSYKSLKVYQKVLSFLCVLPYKALLGNLALLGLILNYNLLRTVAGWGLGPTVGPASEGAGGRGLVPHEPEWLSRFGECNYAFFRM